MMPRWDALPIHNVPMSGTLDFEVVQVGIFSIFRKKLCYMHPSCDSGNRTLEVPWLQVDLYCEVKERGRLVVAGEVVGCYSRGAAFQIGRAHGLCPLICLQPLLTRHMGYR